jgi:hypothetical protein
MWLSIKELSKRSGLDLLQNALIFLLRYGLPHFS